MAVRVLLVMSKYPLPVKGPLLSISMTKFIIAFFLLSCVTEGRVFCNVVDMSPSFLNAVSNIFVNPRIFKEKLMVTIRFDNNEAVVSHLVISDLKS